MKERVVTFGPNERMVGVLTEPDAGAGNRPCLMLLNAGWIHRSGPGRLAVALARSMVDAGFATLRYDFSGIGDSAARVPPLDAIACGIADAKDAMDHLASTYQRFVLFGLCSGARHAHHIATADPRVVGAVLLDGYSFPTLRSNAMLVRGRIEDPIALLSTLRRRLLRLFSGQPVTGPMPVAVPDDDGEAFFPADPTRADMARDLAKLARRKVELLTIYSGEWRKYAYEGQLRDAFPEVPLAGLLVEKLFATADHLYFTEPERTQLLATVGEWMRQRYAR